MATIATTNTLDVADKYDTLVKQSLGGDSAYIRAKETIEELVASGAIDETQKAEVISSILGGVINAITSSSMSTAVEWAKIEKEIELEKLKLTWQLDTLEQDSLLKAAQVEQTYNAIRLAKVESKRLYGAGTFVGNDLAALEDAGKVYTEIQLTDAQRLKTDAEKTLTTQKMQESYAAVHKIIADTYVNFGNYSYAGLTATGISTVTPNHQSHTTLSEVQKSIATEQAKGYTYNAWANALTGSASLLGTALASDVLGFETDSTEKALLLAVKDVAVNLKNATIPVI